MNLNLFFETILKDLNCKNETRAYIVSIFLKYQNSNFDLSDRSITIEFFEARNIYNFEKFQNLGDWIFFYNSVFDNSNKKYFDEIGKESYAYCYKIVKQWELFNELSVKLPLLENQTKILLKNNNIKLISKIT